MNMSTQLTQYELFRLKRMQNGDEEDNMSAHFSNKESFPDMSDRPQTNSARSSPQQLVDQLQMQLALARKQNKELAHKYSALEEDHKQLQAKCNVLEGQLKNCQILKDKAESQLQARVEKERGTKGKLKQWVVAARQNLSQF